MNESPHTFTQRILIAVGIITVVVLLLLLLWFAIDIFLLAFAAVLLAIFLRGLSNWVSEHTPLSKRWSFALVTIALVGITGGGIWLLAPDAANQIDELGKSLPQSIGELTQRLENYEWGQQLIAQLPSTDELLASRANALTTISSFFSTTLGAFADLIIVLFVGLHFAADPHLYLRGVVRLVPLNHRSRAREVLDEVGHALGRWLIGQLASMTVIGILTTIGLWLLGVPLALTLGLIAGLLSFIPNLGPIIALVPAALLALLQGPMTVLYVILLYTVIQTLESYLLTPFMQKWMISLPPALTIFVQVLLGFLLGGLGLVLATPLLAAGLVLVRMLYVEDVLHDSTVTDSKEK